MRPALIVPLLLVLGGCSTLHRFGLGHAEHTQPEMVFSPNGEPLTGGPLGHPSCPDAMGRWFARVDANHDGTIDLEEFLADARRQFAAMDLDKTGVLTPDVLARYRAPFSGEPPAESAARLDTENERPRRRSGDRDDEDSGRGQDRVDPVMLADVDLRNRVTLDEFLAYARRNFASLDTNHDGRLDTDEIAKTCASPP